MTKKTATAILSDLGFTLKKTDYDDYRINVRGGSEATAYYTPDLDDAVNTAQAMVLSER